MSKTKKTVKRTKPLKDFSNVEKVTLYHFTSLFRLPAIIKEGIRKGEVPIKPTGPVPSAANMTKNPNPEVTNCWAATVGLTDKLKIRITAEVPKSKISTFAEVNRAFNVSATMIKQLSPNGEGKDWSYVFSGVPTDWFTKVEVNEAGEYREVAGEELDSLVERIAEETRRVVKLNGSFCSLNHGEKNSWLFDGRME